MQTGIYIVLYGYVEISGGITKMLQTFTTLRKRRINSMSYKNPELGQIFKDKRDWLKTRGISITQADVNDILRYSSQSYVSRLEKGEVDISKWNMIKLEKLFSTYQLTQLEIEKVQIAPFQILRLQH